MTSERLYFEEIRERFSLQADTQPGKMMSSEAIVYKGKVFAFLSKKDKMVFKLGPSFDAHNDAAPLELFSPFKSKKPMKGWYELGYENHTHWDRLTQRAFETIKAEL